MKIIGRIYYKRDTALKMKWFAKNCGSNFDKTCFLARLYYFVPSLIMKKCLYTPVHRTRYRPPSLNEPRRSVLTRHGGWEPRAWDRPSAPEPPSPRGSPHGARGGSSWGHVGSRPGPQHRSRTFLFLFFCGKFWPRLLLPRSKLFVRRGKLDSFGVWGR